MVTASEVHWTFGLRHSKGALGGALLALSCAVLLALVGGSAAFGATVYVPDDYPTIQGAVNAAPAGDTVYVRAGTYYEHVTIKKFLTLQGENRETTIIDGGGSGNVVYVYAASDVLISGLTIRNGYKGAYLCRATSGSIVDCNVSHNYRWGIDLEYSPHAEVRNCDVSDSYGPGTYDGMGIRTWEASHSVIEDVRVFDNKGHRAFCPYWSSGMLIKNVELFNNAGGLFPGYGSYEMVNISIHDSGYGLYFNGASGGSLRDSVIRSVDGPAVRLTWYSSGNVIEGNTLESNHVGVTMDYAASSNVIQGNIIESNVGIGFGGGPQPRGNRFYHNDIIGNGVQVSETPGSPAIAAQVWDNGYPSGGNYWSDYAGVDLFSGPSQNIPGSDGIGDAPYWIPPTDPAAKDNYPLMRPWRADLALPVDIDIKPGSYPNSINLGSQGVIPVAILSDARFDATTVDPYSVALAGAGVALRGKAQNPMAKGEDVDGDGLLDLIVHVETENFDPGTFQEGFACLEGETYDGQLIEGWDEITIVPPEGDAVATDGAASASTEAASTSDGQAPDPVVTVAIDAQPGSDPNSINLGAEGVIPVAIFSTDTFDATQVDPSSVILEGFEGVAVMGIPGDYPAHQEDVDGDGLLDLVIQVGVINLNPGAMQDGVVWLAGCTHDGQPIEGTDAIIIVPPEG